METRERDWFACVSKPEIIILTGRIRISIIINMQRAADIDFGSFLFRILKMGRIR